MKKRLLDIFFGDRMEILEDIMNADVQYRRIREEALQTQEKLDTMGLTFEQKAVVEELVAKTNQSGAVYGKMAYEHGFRDGAKLMSELKGII